MKDQFVVLDKFENYELIRNMLLEHADSIVQKCENNKKLT